MATRIYTNGYSLFTLENFGKTAGACEVNGITFHDEVRNQTARAMHTNGNLHYVFGNGDRKELKGIALNRKMKLKSFKIS